MYYDEAHTMILTGYLLMNQQIYLQTHRKHKRKMYAK